MAKRIKLLDGHAAVERVSKLDELMRSKLDDDLYNELRAAIDAAFGCVVVKQPVYKAKPRPKFATVLLELLVADDSFALVKVQGYSVLGDWWKLMAKNAVDRVRAASRSPALPRAALHLGRSHIAAALPCAQAPSPAPQIHGDKQLLAEVLAESPVQKDTDYARKRSLAWAATT
eukprot:2225996-Prymnesium_polylepis.2